MKKNSFGTYNENTTTDSYDAVIDLDSGEVVESKPKSRAKYPNAKKVFALFPRRERQWDINTTQLKHAELLFEEHGIADIQEALVWYEKRKDREFMPRIDSPHDLSTKWVKLEAVLEKQ